MQTFIPLAIGIIIGVIARLALPPREPNATTITVLLAAAGAFIGGRVGGLLGWYHATDVTGIAAAVAGAIVLVAIYRGVARPRRLRPRRMW